MKKEHKIIMKEIEAYLIENPSQRFGQALTNLNIIGFADEKQPEKYQHLLRDIFHDTDNEILLRITSIKNTKNYVNVTT